MPDNDVLVGDDGELSILATPGLGKDIRTVEKWRQEEYTLLGRRALKEKYRNTLNAARFQSDLDSWGPSLARDEYGQSTFHDFGGDNFKGLVNSDFYFEGPYANAFVQFLQGPPRTPYSFLSGLWDGYKEAGIPGSLAESISDLRKRINDRREAPNKYVHDLQKGYRPTTGLTKRDLTPLLDARDKNLTKYLDGMVEKLQPQEPFDKDAFMKEILEMYGSEEPQTVEPRAAESIDAVEAIGKEAQKYPTGKKVKGTPTYPRGGAEPQYKGNDYAEGIIYGMTNAKEWAALQSVSEANLLEQLKYILSFDKRYGANNTKRVHSNDVALQHSTPTSKSRKLHRFDTNMYDLM